MFYEMAASETAMAALVTAGWACMVMAANALQRTNSVLSEKSVVEIEHR